MKKEGAPAARYHLPVLKPILFINFSVGLPELSRQPFSGLSVKFLVSLFHPYDAIRIVIMVVLAFPCSCFAGFMLFFHCPRSGGVFLKSGGMFYVFG